MPRKLRIGILGTGNIARQFADGVRRSYRCEIAAVASRSSAPAEAFARKHGIGQAYGSYDALLADRKIDAVYISGPNSIHYEWTIRSLRAGKHVLCEKPFALDAAQAEEMFDVAHAAGRVAMEAFMYLCHPQTQAIVDAVRRGTIGSIKLIRSSFCYCTSRIAGNIRFDRRLGGGALMDVGCYCISLSRLLAGEEPRVIHALAVKHESGVDELTSGVMQFPGGILASFTCGMLTHADNTAHLSGSEGWIECAWPWKPSADKSGYVVSQNIPPRQDQKTPSKPAAPERRVVPIPVEGDLFGIEADEFAGAVLDGTPPRISREFTIGNMKVMDEIRRQIALTFD
ncbi:MAG: Gfo/Idh/MocA family oxidoreductase [Phycisphaerae bacterium]|nr:Gfo/Idh/MocA family oxidoreductase [Phycisphaerae bacterium]MDW8261927.1 Gfo/Idh/MocA family oxidoreductase [Phycisphaerales bacterium]